MKSTTQNKWTSRLGLRRLVLPVVALLSCMMWSVNVAAEPENAKPESAELTQAPTTQDITPFKDDVQESMYRELTAELRCPKCQNQNIADSNAVIAQDMRVKTKELLDEGYSKEDVIDYMVNRYGQFAHYQPPLTLATSILYFLPVAFVLFCIVLLIQKSQRSGTRQADADVASQANSNHPDASDLSEQRSNESELDRELNALLDDRPGQSHSNKDQ